ncbi:MAG: SdiA-regulated domain-containing protein [Zoogloeaceae bacterium]|nr:SdiA-regulated domain-containing protein [Zoogloeaceae bacterium]
MEGISHVGGNDFFITDERTRTIYRISLEADTRRIDVTKMPRLALGIQFNNER